ncbi:diguanylate cyclase [Vibrio coralliilyticus]|uniref:Diguanylate cyclase n=1 Tax=Vibrio coralliilyticus TaxID=190893 RepID=A0A2A2MYY0_9VIBR|nr:MULTISPECIES: diguanylate cyclase [Vibrio]AIS57456.1 diguanylate cyclase [Vibrio coralliilyticus]AXN34311.1 diguanylate cyclase [Vibrio coralliilyticus]EEX32274.1 GGDEF family protein [Vibrio coralliilyticus ATCC BAA-450]ERB66135.1 diguanylate cyclase [Vibrio coralliilyticus OCN008]KFI11188.1 diguanylate cyclase [Vibrio sp. B183]
MLDSLFKKLFVLSTTTLMLTLFIIISFAKVAGEQRETKAELDQIIDLQLCVDLLRSQLWVFLQFGDESSLNQVELAQAELATKLTAYKQNNSQLGNIQRMNHSLNALLNKEKQVYFLSINGLDEQGSANINARGLLHSRYNMIVQNMTEELAYVHQSVLNRNANSLHQVMLYAAAWLIICSVLVSATAWLISFRFKSGAEAMKNAIIDLAEGKLDSKVEAVKMDTEFRIMAQFFNQMTMSLCETTVTKQELEEEVMRQTQQLKHKQEQLIFLSEHDPLTNLVNRRAFDKALENAIVKANRTQCKLAIFFIDLDDFKSVNDTFGHEAGDAILVEVASRITAAIRESDFVGRFGGDEFVICLDLLHDFDIVAKKAEQLLDAINAPIEFNGRTLKVGASIGVSYFPDQTKNKEVLLSIADEAMYRAKQMAGSACFDGKTTVCKKGSKSVRLTSIND